jgi:hypothetical protein
MNKKFRAMSLMITLLVIAVFVTGLKYERYRAGLENYGKFHGATIEVHLTDGRVETLHFEEPMLFFEGFSTLQHAMDSKIQVRIQGRSIEGQHIEHLRCDVDTHEDKPQFDLTRATFAAMKCCHCARRAKGYWGRFLSGMSQLSRLVSA